MDEQNLLSRLRHGDEQALATAIAQYSAYVVTGAGMLCACSLLVTWMTFRGTWYALAASSTRDTQ